MPPQIEIPRNKKVPVVTGTLKYFSLLSLRRHYPDQVFMGMFSDLILKSNHPKREIRLYKL